MKLYAPKYYKEFKCIADKCTHSCCIGWEIDIDDTACNKYESLTGNYADNIKTSLENGDTVHFKLGCDGRCPHLDSTGLCKIITNLGEDFLCDICREHPRFYNDTVRGKEVGIGLACEEACRNILQSDNYDEIIEIAEITENSKAEFDILPFREHIYNLLSDNSLDYSEKLSTIYRKYGVSPKIISDTEWQNVILSLEYLDNMHKELFLGYSSEIKSSSEIDKQLERILAYFVYRYLGAAQNEVEIRAALGLSLFLERLIASLATTESIAEIARIVSEEIEYSEDNIDTIKTEFYF